MWERWSHSESLKSIGRYFDRSSSSIYNVYRAPEYSTSYTKRSCLVLSLFERHEISRGLASDLSLRSIALQLKHTPSTISRKIKCTGGIDTYRTNEADYAACDRVHRPKAMLTTYECMHASYGDSQTTITVATPNGLRDG